MSERQYKHFNVSKPREWVAHVEINRAEKLNAFTQVSVLTRTDLLNASIRMWLELRTVFDSLSEDSSVRAIVLTGAGDKAFSAGLDVQAALTPGSVFNPVASEAEDVPRQAAVIRRFAYEFQNCVSSIERCEKPVICVLHGLSIGIAIDIAVCADIRICAEGTLMSVKEVDIGIASDVSTLARLPKVVGSYSWVKDVCMTARAFDASEALRVGFVSSVFPNKEEAVLEAYRLAAFLADKSPVAVQGTKALLDWSRDNNIASGLQYSAVWNGAAVQTKDVRSALEATLAGKQAMQRKGSRL